MLSIHLRLVRFYLPKKARWESISKQTIGVGEYLTDVVREIARENPKLQGVIDLVDFNATTAGQRVLSDESLKRLIEILWRYRLGLKDVEPDIFGRAYEYLLRKFAEDSGQFAGEFYTPKEVAIMMAYLLDPEPGQEVYDSCCGSGGILIKIFLRFKEKYGENTTLAPLKFYGQEILASTFTIMIWRRKLPSVIQWRGRLFSIAMVLSKNLIWSLPIRCGIRNLNRRSMKTTHSIGSYSAFLRVVLPSGSESNTCMQASRIIDVWLW